MNLDNLTKPYSEDTAGKMLSLRSLIGEHYDKAFTSMCRYNIIKGSRNSKKSVDMIGFRAIFDILDSPLNNVLIVRENEYTNRQSTFANILNCLNRMGIMGYFKVNKNPLEITYKPTGQMIFFRGMNNPTTITSITVQVGVLNRVYIEEAYEIPSYEDFRKLDGSIRGVVPSPKNCFKITMVLNGWNIEHWIHDVFFVDKETGLERLPDNIDKLESDGIDEYCDPNYIGDYGKGLYLATTNYLVNEFRDPFYDLSAKEMKKRSIDIYLVEYLGCWGNPRGVTYPEFTDSLVKPLGELLKLPYIDYAIGIDTGLSNGEGNVIRKKDKELVRSATTMVLKGITKDFKEQVALGEYYWTNEGQAVPKTEPQLYEEMLDVIMKWKETFITSPIIMKGVCYVMVDCADIGFRQGLELVARKRGLINIKFIGSTKHKIQTRIDYNRLQMAWGEYLVANTCPNLVREIKACRTGDNGAPRLDTNDHAINADEYAFAPFMSKMSRWKTFKDH